MIERELAAVLVNQYSNYPFVMVTGPRGAGKTTFCCKLFPHLPYTNLESPEQREFATRDPNGFLASLGDRAIIDEIQRAPDLIPCLERQEIDTQRDGGFIMISSENSEIIESIKESFAGWIMTLCLLPLTLSETALAGSSGALNDVLYSGFYPRVHDQAITPREALSRYFATFLDGDIRRIGGVRDLDKFELFTRLCAGRIGRTMDLVALGRDAGVSHTTARNWFQVLEASFIAFRLPPTTADTRKRLVKSPKLYFYDVGLAAYLMGIETSDQIITHPLRGALFENMVVAETMKYRFNKGKPANLHFFRDNHGLECELLLGLPSALAAIEIKSSATIPSDAFDSLNAIESAVPDIESKCLVYGGTNLQSNGDIEVVPFNRVSETLAGLEIGKDVASSTEPRIDTAISSMDSDRLNDLYAHWIDPMIQTLRSSLEEFQSTFGSISQLEFVEYGQNQVISPTLFSADTWESTKQDHLAIGLDGLSEQEPLTLVHQTTFTGFTSDERGELAIEVRIQWVLSGEGLRQTVWIDGESMHDLDSELVAYENLSTSSKSTDGTRNQVLDEIRIEIERHRENTG